MLKQPSPALRISLIYFFISVIWIFTSDALVASISTSTTMLNFLQTIKGWFFVSTTAYLIYLLIKKYFKIQEQLHKSVEEKHKDFETIFQESPNPIIVYNEDGEVLMMNKIWLELTGYRFEEINTIEKWTNKAFKDKGSEVKAYVNELYVINKRVDNGIFSIYTKTNENIIWHFNSAPFGIRNNKKTIISSAIDITELEKKNKLLVHQSKMAALGEMLENIAHQWRQPLSTISTIATGVELKKEMDDLDDEYLKDSMKNINNNAQYLSTTIDDFRKFFDQNKTQELFNIKETIEKSFDLLYAKMKSTHIQIEKDLFDIQIQGLQNEFIQVIINLLNNSVDALMQSQNEKLIRIELQKNDKEVFIILADTGGGIKEEIIHKIFEPYFTTKHQSQGTGIGLYMSEEIIVNHMNGKIEVSNAYLNYGTKEYLGAKFIITLPLKNTI